LIRSIPRRDDGVAAQRWERSFKTRNNLCARETLARWTVPVSSNKKQTHTAKPLLATRSGLLREENRFICGFMRRKSGHVHMGMDSFHMHFKVVLFSKGSAAKAGTRSKFLMDRRVVLFGVCSLLKCFTTGRNWAWKRSNVSMYHSDMSRKAVLKGESCCTFLAFEITDLLMATFDVLIHVSLFSESCVAFHTFVRPFSCVPCSLMGAEGSWIRVFLPARTAFMCERDVGEGRRWLVRIQQEVDGHVRRSHEYDEENLN